MDRLSLNAQERLVLGKKVKLLRKDGIIPGHVFGDKVDTEHVAVDHKEFWTVYHQAGETGVIDLKIGAEKVRPVMVKGIQYDPVKDQMLHIDFFQVDLSQKVKVPVPIVVIGGEDIESVKMGESVVLQTLAEIEVEALPTDLIENFEVSIAHLVNIDDAITVGQLSFDHSKITITNDLEEIVVKLAPAVTEEMKKLMEEQAAEAAAAAAATEAEAGEGAEGAEGVEGEEGATEEGAESTEGGEAAEKPAEGSAEEKKEGE